MEDFINKKYDILLTTSIIESGMDIENVNTLIVENAHRFGLSQLYQLRGRVGRSSERAYAYLLYNQKDILNAKHLKGLKHWMSIPNSGQVIRSLKGP
jgi:transcription-repair coupling factor (superfamily II helicase)